MKTLILLLLPIMTVAQQPCFDTARISEYFNLKTIHIGTCSDTTRVLITYVDTASHPRRFGNVGVCVPDYSVHWTWGYEVESKDIYSNGFGRHYAVPSTTLLDIYKQPFRYKVLSVMK